MRLLLSRRAIRIAVILAGIAFLYLIRSILVPFILAFFLAYLIDPLVEAMQQRGAPRGVAILTVFAVAAILTAAIIALVAPILLADLERAAKMLPDYLERLNMLGARFTRLYNRLHLPLNMRAFLDGLTARATDKMEKAATSAIALLPRLLSGSVMLFIVPIAAYYIARDYHRFKGAIHAWLRERMRPDLLAKAVAVDRALRSYFRAQALAILLMTGILVIGLSLLGLEFALLLGIIAGVLNIIPYFGPVLGALPAILLALTRSPWYAVYVIVLFFVANQLEFSLLVPKVVGGRVGLHPLLVIFVLLLGGKFFGLLGMLVAVPVTAVIKAAASEYLEAMVAPTHGLTTHEASDMIRKDENPPQVPDDSG